MIHVNLSKSKLVPLLFPNKISRKRIHPTSSLYDECSDRITSSFIKNSSDDMDTLSEKPVYESDPYFFDFSSLFSAMNSNTILEDVSMSYDFDSHHFNPFSLDTDYCL